MLIVSSMRLREREVGIGGEWVKEREIGRQDDWGGVDAAYLSADLWKGIESRLDVLVLLSFCSACYLSG